MSRAYNRKYKKGKYLSGSVKSIKADTARLSKRTLEHSDSNYKLWKSDTRRYDYAGLDTPDWFNKEYGFSPNNPHKYVGRSLKKMGKKQGRENVRHRRYWYGKTFKKRRR